MVFKRRDIKLFEKCAYYVQYNMTHFIQPFQEGRSFVNITHTEKFRPRGYKTFSMLNSTEHEISTTHEN